MQAVEQTTYGDPSVLNLVQVPEPTPAPGQLLIRVQAVAVTQAEVALSSGTPWVARLYAGLLRPRIRVPGMAVAGTVVALGDGVSTFVVGDRVYGATLDGGGLAELACLDASGLVRHIPDGLSEADAIGVLEAQTAWWFLRHVAKVQPGWSVLVNGASGAVGSTAVQIARHLGATVTGVCSTRNVALVRELGAERVIDYTTTDFTRDAGRYDLILDAVGKSSFGACRHLLRPGGTWLTTAPTPGTMLWSGCTALFGGPRCRVAFAGLNQSVEQFGELEALVRSGTLRSVVDRTYPLGRAADAFAYVATGRKRGVVLVCLDGGPRDR